MLPAKIYSFTVPANGMFELLVVGEFFKVLSASGAFEVNGDTFGRIGNLESGQGLRNVPFQRLQFVDETGANNNLRVLVADADFIDDRIAGEVSVVDGGKARTASGIVWGGTPQTAAPAAGSYAIVQLWNPSTTKRLVVTQLSFGCNVASGASVYGSNAPLATNLTATSLGNKQMGASISGAAGQLRGGTSVGLPAFPYGPVHLAQLAASIQYVWVPRNEPIVVPPGFGLSIVNRQDGLNLDATFEWWEEDVA